MQTSTSNIFFMSELVSSYVVDFTPFFKLLLCYTRYFALNLKIQKMEFFKNYTCISDTTLNTTNVPFIPLFLGSRVWLLTKRYTSYLITNWVEHSQNCASWDRCRVFPKEKCGRQEVTVIASTWLFALVPWSLILFANCNFLILAQSSDGKAPKFQSTMFTCWIKEMTYKSILFPPRKKSQGLNWNSLNYIFLSVRHKLADKSSSKLKC